MYHSSNFVPAGLGIAARGEVVWLGIINIYAMLQDHGVANSTAGNQEYIFILLHKCTQLLLFHITGVAHTLDSSSW